MKLSSSQRWAIGAVTLALLIACSPRAPEEPAQPSPSVPALAPGTVSAEAPEPGFAGEWAFVEGECGEATRTFKLSSKVINMTPGERSCQVRSFTEEHPTGRSAVYKVSADCLTEGETTQDRFTLNFGAADTVMQLQLNDRDPVRLVRCP